MIELVFLLEEESAQAMLMSLLPRFLNPSIAVRYITFEGKQDLDRQLTKKLKHYLNPQARFIVLRDQDSVPVCTVLKQALVDKCVEAGKQNVSMVRIACHELETFYLADLAAVSQVFNLSLVKQQLNTKFRAPDYLANPKQELQKLTRQAYQQISGSRDIAQYLDLENTRSTSFSHLIMAIRGMEQELIEFIN
ncbi:MAG: DUF4276 family protein [Sulfuriferula sp.]